ncbi:crosslink repair DNA glycosylase YcaQ family protein, partial [Jatrophihabitans endophyticus]|uniref:DNA glycosylase AlkZ-like family protein n=1 Tax=Jatrophihabitans endophyticus TaxID=1206085 RepID=UPI001A0B1CD6
MLTVDRAQVLAYRVAAQGLHRDASGVGELAVLDLGVQEAMGQPAGYAFAARLPADVDLAPGAMAIGPGNELAFGWTLRGAPHVHRRADLDRLAAALWPMSEADAAGRLNETGPSVARAGIPALEQFGLAVDAMHAVVRSSIAKGAASTAVTAALPDVMARDCRPCRARHVSDSAMRSTALAAGVEIEPGTNPPVLVHRPRARRPKRTDGAALAGLAESYLRLLGPARPADVAGYLECRRADLVEQGWPDGLDEVSVDGRTCWLPSSAIDALRDPREPDVVRLLGPFDPYLQARDRDLLVPDSTMHKT